MAENLQAAFVAAWNDCENPELDSENPHFHNKFASLKATLAEVRKACKPHGIAYSQRHVLEEGRGVLKSYVVGMGEVMELSSFPVECPPNPQSFGSNLTYARRQQAHADWGITGEADDDAEAAAAFQSGFNSQQSQEPATAPQSAPQTPLGNDPVVEDKRRQKMLARCAELSAKCIENGMKQGATEGFMKARFKVDDVSELDNEQLIEFGKYLNEMVEQSADLKAKKEEQ